MKRILYVLVLFSLLSLSLSASLILFTISPCHALGMGCNSNGFYVVEAVETSPNTWVPRGHEYEWNGLGVHVPVDWGSNHAYFTVDTAHPNDPANTPCVKKTVSTFSDFNDDEIFLSSHIQDPDLLYSPEMTSWQEKVDTGYYSDGYSEIFPNEVREFILTTEFGSHYTDSGFFNKA